MYQIVKIQWKIIYIRCTDRPNLFKNSNSLNAQIHENLMENRRTYQIMKIPWKMCTIDVQIVRTC